MVAHSTSEGGLEPRLMGGRSNFEKEGRMKLSNTQRGVLLLTLIAGMVLGGLFSSGLRVAKAATTQAAADATPLQVPDPVQLSTAFTKLAKQLEPSVVQVTSTIEQKTVQQRRGGRPGWKKSRIRPTTCSRRFFGQDPFGGDIPNPAISAARVPLRLHR